MTFEKSISNCLSKYATFEGRASRSEYWWWLLFLFLASSAAAIYSERLCDLFWLAVLVPTVAVTARRLHDTNRSGWWQLLQLLPVIGTIVLIVWCIQISAEPNRFEHSSPQAVA